MVAEHVHGTLVERFRVMAGRVAFRIEGEERTLGPGESAEVPSGVRHDWWQVGNEEAEVMVEVVPGDRFIEIVGTLFGLARDRKTDPRGLPGPLQLAVTAQAYRDVVVFTQPATWVQRLVFGALSPIGRVLGRRPFYPRYLESTETVEPDPAALALLTPDGRLAGEGAGAEPPGAS